MNRLTVALCLALLAGCAKPPTETAFSKDETGIVVAPAEAHQRRVRLEVRSDRILRVTTVDDAKVLASLPASLMVVPSNKPTPQFTVAELDGALVLETAKLVARVSLDDGAVSVSDKAGHPLLAEQPAATWPARGVSRRFNPGTDEGLFGSGQHQNAQLDLNGEDVQLAQHNMDIGVPFVVSTRNYGVLWDNNGITRIGDPTPYGLASRDLKITDAAGKEGGFTARYSIKGELKLERVEKDIDYQYIKDRAGWPKELQDGKQPAGGSPPGILPDQTVTWEGTLTSPKDGNHKFQLYGSSYFKVFIDGRVVLDRWRQNWAAWYQNFDVPMTAGKPVKFRLEWIPDGGYIALLHNDPLPEAERHSLTFTSDTGNAVDYYVVAGASQEDVIAGYRELTGKAVMLPKWAYGFWQSRQRYTNQQELLDVVAEYRKRRIPLDNIVLDWQYWKPDSWGTHEFDATRFPDPAKMMDTVHGQHVNLMLSVWPKFYASTANYKEFDAAGFIYRRNVEQGAVDWVGPGYANAFYDPYSKAARDMYWRQMHDKLGALNIDAWWMDATEPDPHSNLDVAELQKRNGPTALGPGENYFNTYALMHSGGVYDGARAARPDKRVFILTRSGTAGIQRNAAATWSGDIAMRWVDLYNQISAGVSMSYSGLPNWTFDSGGYATEARYNAKPMAPADREEFREINLRWFQMAAFMPIFRSHGEYPFRELYNIAPPQESKESREVFESMVWYDTLRYRLLPYTYTLAADLYHRDGTILRGLPMDFPDDREARAVKDEYLFGKAFLVAPVYEHKARGRAVYLPAGSDWYDFESGALARGGQRIEAAAPLARMPLFVRAGAIVPVGPELQYTSEKPGAPLTLLVFTGADGAFDYYEDDGLSYRYEKGEFLRIPLRFDSGTGTLHIGARAGAYPGMPATRTINVRWIKTGAKAPADFAAAPDATVEYTGAEASVKIAG